MMHNAALQTHGDVTSDQIYAVHAVEDPSDDPKAISYSGAVGEMQMKPETFKSFADKGADITDPQANYIAGARYLDYLWHKYKDWDSVFQAYNVGETAFDSGSTAGQMYARQVEANYNYIKQSYKPQPPKLSKGAPKPPGPMGPPASLAAKKPQQNPPLSPHQQAGMYAMTHPWDFLAQLDSADAEARDAASGIQANTPEAWKQKLAELSQAGDVQNAGKAANFIGNLVNLAPEAINALMRDTADGNFNNIGDVGHNVLQILGDWKNGFSNVSGFLDALANKYGINTASEFKFWLQKPGVQDLIRNGSPNTGLGQYLQLAAAMHADAARIMATHAGLADLYTFAIEWWNPANKIPLGILSRVSGLGKAAAATEMGQHLGVIAKKIPGVEKAGAGYNWVAEHAPIVGDRFRKTQRLAGTAEADQHAKLAGVMANRVPAKVERDLFQANKLGQTTKAQRVAIWREHDLFFNPDETVRVAQPGGVGDPAFDEFTRTTTGTKGGAIGGDHDNHVYVHHTDPNPYKLSKSKTGNLEIAKMYGDQGFAQFSDAIKRGNVAAALKLEPSISPAEAKAFAKELKARMANIDDPEAKKQFAREMILKRMISAYASKYGHTAVEWGPKQVLYTLPMKGIDRNMDNIGGMTVHDRAVATAESIARQDMGLSRLLPSTAALMRDKHWSRNGAFSKEATFQERMEAERTAGNQHKGAGSQGPNLKGRLVYKSIRDAESKGEKVADDFDPALPLMRQLVRSNRLAEYGSYLLGHAEPIRYDELAEGAYNSGMLGPLLGEAGLPGALEEGEEGAEAEEGAWHGAEGKKKFDKWAEQEAQARVSHRLGRQVDTTDDAKIKEMVEEEKNHVIFKAIENYFEQKNPGHTFRTPIETGLADLDGMTVPDWAKDAAIDSHPAFDSGVKTDKTLQLAGDTPNNMFMQIMEDFSSAARSFFLADPTYHERFNLAPIAFVVGKLNFAELSQIFVAPHSIDPKLMDEAEREQALSTIHGHGVGGPKAQVRNLASSGYQPVEKNLVKRQLTLSQRWRMVHQAHQNALDGTEGIKRAGHLLSSAMYHYDKWNADLTFKVYEDATSAVLYGKLKREFKNKGFSERDARGRAARETRKMMGDSLNMTDIERRLGLHRLTWFYSWIKGQYRLWMKNVLNPRVIGATNATKGAVATQDQLTDPDNAGEYQDKNEGVFWIGDKRYAINPMPGPMGRLQAIDALVAAPVSRGEGLMDFLRYAASSEANSLNPNLKNVFALYQAINQNPDSGDPNALWDASMPGDIQAKEAIKNTAGTLLPTQATALQHGASDPVRFLELLGRPVRPVDDIEGAGPLRALEAKLHKRESEMLYNAATPDERAQIKDDLGRERMDLLQQLHQMQGR